MTRLAVQSKILDSAAAAWDFLSRGAQGWYTTPGEASFWREPSPVTPTRRVLDGESVSADRAASYHLRHLGDGRWQATEFRESADGEAFEVERHTLLANLPDLGNLTYELAWQERAGAVGGTFPALEPRFARFTGFGGN